MAAVSANYGLDINLVDFHVMADGDASVTSTYVRVVYDGGTTRATFTGSGIAVDAHGTVTSGTVTGYKEEFLSNGSWVADWSMQGMAPVSAVSVYNAILSAGTSDDLALLQQALAGGDTANLSNEADIVVSYAGNDRVNGLGGNDRIDGSAGNDTLDGGLGNDTLIGGAGNDSLVGGSGSDSLVGGTGNDVYAVNASTDRIAETSTVSTEVDLVQSSVTWSLGANLERLTLTGSAVIHGTGNALANVLTGNAAANALNGGAGNDVLSAGAGNDILNGGAGNDSLVGGSGNDSYVVDAVGDRITESTTLASEIDIVSASVSWTLGDNLERLTLTGSAVIHATGNGLANVLTGNAAANVLNGGLGNDALSGGAGNDWLIGGTGNDILTGGAGLDAFRFVTTPSATLNVDRIADFLAADDRIDLDDAVFTAIGPVGALSAAAFRAGTAAADSSDRVIYNDATGQLLYDADGSGGGAAVLFATVTAHTALTVADLFVV